MKFFAVIVVLAGTVLNVFAEVKHTFLCVDNGKNQLIYVDQFVPLNSWQVSIARGARDIQIIDGAVMVSHSGGAAFYSLETGKKLSQLIEGLKGIQTAHRFPDGRTLLANNSKIYIYDKHLKQEKVIVLPKTPRPRVRLIEPTGNGTLLYATQKPFGVTEITIDGQEIWRSVLPHKGYKHLRLNNGNTLNSTGYECKVVEIDNAGSIISYVGGKKEHPDLNLDFCSGWDLLDNGNIVMTNWLGHGKHGTAPHLVEFTPANKCIWQWENHTLAKQITNVVILK